jgi:hypothetical protein
MLCEEKTQVVSEMKLQRPAAALTALQRRPSSSMLLCIDAEIKTARYLVRQCSHTVT